MNQNSAGGDPENALEPLPEIVSGTVEVAQEPTDERLSESAATRVRRSVPEETRRAYAGDWARYTSWCEQTGRAALPASPVTLAEYATLLADADKAPSTIDRALAAIAVAHRTAGQPRPDNTMARAVLRDHRRQRALSGRGVRKAAPVTVSRLRAMVDTCNLDTAKGLRDRAVMVLGFALASRRSELASLHITDLTFTDAGLEVIIRTSKTDKESAGRTVFVPYGSNPETCPVRTVQAWMSLLQGTGRFTGPKILRSMKAWLSRIRHGLYTGPLFQRIDRHGVIGNVATGRGRGDGRITGQAVTIIVNQAATAAGLDPALCWSGHSLRRGFASEAYAGGAHPLRIDRHGGWRDGSVSKLGYIEDVDRQRDNPLIGIGL